MEVRPASAPALDPPPPQGVIVPAVGRVRSIEAGDRKAAYVWKGVFEADPADPRIQAVIARRPGPGAPDAGDAASILYDEQVEAAGITTSKLDYSFNYVIQGGKLDVIVRPDDQFHQGDPGGFTVFVGIPGG
ncbi:MAG TPA: hypothetical protein VK698_22520 [Kofleriaceae bacterium]|nr:hypothetical protein [Kofleriaceae bacterium]